MMKKIILIFVVILLNFSTLNAWEVNTHRAIDKVALNKQASLENFIIDAKLDEYESYQEITYEGYSTSYFNYITSRNPVHNSSMAQQNFTFEDDNWNYKMLIEAGTILEDSTSPGIPLWGANGRFFNHFYDPQNGSSGYLGSFNALQWAQGENLSQNQYSHTAAREHMKKAFSSVTPAERKKFRAKMFVSIGFLMHLFNDMNVPAHTRGDGHNPDPLELWMKGGEDHNQSYGFRITGNNFGNNDSSIQIAAEGAVPYLFTNFSSPLTDEAYRTSTQFFSKDTIFKGNYKPRESDVNIPAISDRPSDYDYVTDTLGTKLAIVHNSMWWRTVGVAENAYSISDNPICYPIHKENGLRLIPRAVANAAGFVNYFFRGRLEANVTPCGLSVKNNSDASLVASAETVTFSQGGVFNVYVELPEDQSVHLVASVPLDRDLAVGESFSFENINQQLLTRLESLDVSSNQSFPITVMFDGDIGSERGIAVIKTTMNPTEIPEFQDGIITVDLLWQDASLDLDLTVDVPDGAYPGNYENKDNACPTEHFYIKNEELVQVGTYRIKISPKGNVDESMVPEDVYVVIQAKRQVDTLQISIEDTRTFDMGYIAEIEVTEGTLLTTVREETTRGVSIRSVGGGGFYDKYIYQIIWLINQVMYGPVRDAHLELYSISDYVAALSPLFIGSTSTGNDLHTAGVIIFPYSVVEKLVDDELYLLRAEGGQDIDADDDGHVDATPRQNVGALHSVMSGKMIKDGAYKVNVLTELVYQVTKEMFDGNTSEVILERMNKIAPRLISKDVNEDNVINSIDIIKWMPTVDKDKLAFDYETTLEPIVQKLFNGEDIFMDAYKLLYYPVANAGEDRSLGVTEVLKLDGSKSYDINGDIVEYRWTEGDVLLCSSSEPICEIDMLSVYSHSILLSVIDNDGEIHSDRVFITITNYPPTANAGADQIMTEVSTVTLDGSNSYDSNGYIVEYLWTSGDTVYCQSENPICVIENLAIDDYEFRLTVTDNDGVSSSDTMEILYTNTPVSVAGDDQNIFSGQSLILDGSGSYDNDGHIVEYLWYTYEAAYCISSTPECIVDRLSVGNHWFNLTVTDNAGAVNTDWLKVTVESEMYTLGSFDTSGSALDVTLSEDGSIAYIADGGSGLQIIDVSNPAAPSLLGSYDTPNYAAVVVLSADGKTAYVADYSGGLQIIDISNPLAPFLIGSYGTPGYAMNVTISLDGLTAYVADEMEGLQIIDISNPVLPVLIGNYDTPEYAFGVARSDDSNIIYVADVGSLLILDISNPAVPLLMGSCETPGAALDVTLSKDGKTAYVADLGSGLQVIDITNPALPSLIGSYDTSDSAISVTLSADGTIAYVPGSSRGGLQVINIINPASPTLIDSYDTPGDAYGVALSPDGTIAYMADYSGGLQIIDMSGFFR